MLTYRDPLVEGTVAGRYYSDRLRRLCNSSIIFLLVILTIFLSGCGRRAKKSLDGAPKNVPAHLMKVPDAKPQVEPLSRHGNRFKNNSNSYVAKRKRYRVMSTSRGYRARGKASWYGTYFHGRKTSSGEKYDMYKMTAAHPTLPLPTYARITNLDNGKTVVVKVNDRGPFHSNRLIDVSYVAAAKLGMLGRGTGRVEVVSVDPRDHGGKTPKIAIASNSTETLDDKFVSETKKGRKNSRTLNLAKHSAKGAILGSTKISDAKAEPKQNIYLQLGTYPQRSKAEAMAKKLERISKLPSQITQNGRGRSSKYQVRIGPVNDNDEAISLTQKLAKARLPAPTVITESLSKHP